MIFKPKNQNQIVTIKTLSDLCDTIELEQKSHNKLEIPIKKEIQQEIKEEPEVIIPVKVIQQETVIEEPKKEVVSKPIPKLIKVGISKNKNIGSDIKWL